ncbi:universal stress protein [Streptomyces sp. NPDC020707]|uniref:universal stress protein n=1 Tax=Streptomyces sp. NPDC020707 TaxID=3365084 RepID=UPI00379E85D5
MSTQWVMVIGDDLSARPRVVKWAACEAARRGLPLRIVHVAPRVEHGTPRHDGGHPRPVANPVATQLAHAHTGLRVDTTHITGTVVREGRSLVRNAQLVVVGIGTGTGTSTGTGAGTGTGTPEESGSAGPFPSPIVREIVGGAACPVVFVPGGPGPARPPNRPTRITVGIDARDPAAGALDFAFGTARLRQARLRAVHAWSLPPAAAELPFRVPEKDRATWEDHEVQLLSDVLRPWRGKYPTVPVLEDVVLFSPTEALLRDPDNAELVVVGRGRPVVHGLSATVDTLLRSTGSPVAVVPE